MAIEEDELLFEIRKSNLETGLRGYPVGYCTTSYVHPEKGLYYIDYPVAEISAWSPEEVIFLLYEGKKGSAEEIAKFTQELRKRGECTQKTLDAIHALPRDAHPMTLFATAILLLGAFEGRNNYQEDCLNLIAKAPYLAAAVINYHAGWSAGKRSKDADYIGNFHQLLGLPSKSEHLKEVFRLFNILHYDHGGGNLSTFVGKAVASGLQDLYGSLAAAMLALAGPLHGRANQECLHFVEEMVRTLGEDAQEKEVEQEIRARLARKEIIYGFGHAVLRVEDPRAEVQYAFAQKHFSSHPLVKMVLCIRRAGSRVLKENPKIANPYPNVDAISGTLLTAAGFSYPDYYTVLFGMARVVGIAIQIVYERMFARAGRGTPIVRPKYLFKSRTPK
jgi:citrate synthase